MADSQFDLIVVGGGVVGLSTAMNALQRFPRLRLLVVEKERELAAHQSGHNSGVLHSGIYYKPGSLRAKLCVEGRAAMVEFCRTHGLPHDVCGKVVVATDESELPRLEDIYQRGLANGVPGLVKIGPEQLREHEPHCRGIAALWVPCTGITDYAAVTRKYAEIVAAGGGVVRTVVEVTGLARRGGETTVETTSGAFTARYAVTCGGLHADRLRRMSGAGGDYVVVPFRGEYYKIVPERQHLVRGLIYPVPDPRFPFLGVHFTRMIRGGIEAGPNAVLSWKREGYGKTDFSARDAATMLRHPGFWRMASKYWDQGFAEMYRSFSKKAFHRALQRLLPDLAFNDIEPGGSGVRAQVLDKSGALLDDFTFLPSDGVLHVLNVPSPAATSSLVVGRKIVDLLAETGGVA